MLLNQSLKLDKGKVILRNTVDDEYAAKAAYTRRRELNIEGNAKGWSRERTLMHAARIPAEAFAYDPNLIEYQNLRAAGNREEASRYLLRFLQENPQFRCSEAVL